MDDVIDLLKIKIEKAKRELPEETLNAIATVDWRAKIFQLREKKGYSFEQLGDLELETELLLCGLLSPENYPKELEKGMGISGAQANELVNEMNDLVFKKIREGLIKNIERKKVFANKKAEKEDDVQILNSHGIEIIPAHTAAKSTAGGPTQNASENMPSEKETLPIPDKLELETKPDEKSKPREEMDPILTQKLSASFQVPVVKTEHSLENISKTNVVNPVITKPKIPNVDPYRETPE